MTDHRSRRTVPQKRYDRFITMAANSLKPGEYWCIRHPNGEPLLDTKSKDLGAPVRLICDALNCDWDELTEQGYRISCVTEGASADIDK